MKAVRVMLVIAVLWCGAAFGDSMEGVGTASGNVVLWFSGTSATATFEGAFALTGQLMIADTVTPFSASGWVRGEGSGDTATLDLEAWATFAASGTTEEGTTIAVQGGLTLSGLSAELSGSSGAGSGDFFATVFIGEQQYHVQGSAEGSASGSFVVPQDPLSMELAGDGIFNLAGEMSLVSPAPQGDGSSGEGEASTKSELGTSVIELLPWDIGSWPEELLATLLEILTQITVIPASPEADSQAE